ncbi:MULTISPECIES: DUF6471 domain-containing protein [Burkholderia cepacia complex]|jgi:hypothetical protein|uniref:DUF6471 domain-containing protein n=1 Tax=Burkholderia cepacia complex TaxID=87882 RepID=UPI001BA0AD45|nr:DUF6471 domain-containing protein [Burkholderia ambifaria]MBR8221069.1 hypothetical protein [Burkholderia ambifaria]
MGAMSPEDRLQKEPPYAQWEDRARELVVSAMVQRDLSYKDLARLLEPYGIEESADQINRKINRKRFSAAFLLACLVAMKIEFVPVF